MALTPLMKSAARILLHRAGGLNGVRYWNRGKFRILMYHDFLSVPGMEQALARQFEHISRYYHVVTMNDIARHLKSGVPLPKNALAVTVDDGGRDFFLRAYPILKAYKIPATVYLVSGFLDRKFWLWWDQVEFLFKESRRTSVHIPLLSGAPPVKFAIETPEEREKVIELTKETMKNLQKEEQIRLMKELPGILGVDLPRDPPPHMEPLSWSEARELSQNGIEIGAHTMTHPVLSRMTDRTDLLAEIGGSKKRIEEELQRPVIHFCYPYGCWEDFNDETIKVLEQTGFQTAVTAQHGMNTHDAHPFKLLRLAADPMLPEFYFQECLAGLHTG
jgi:peptidoglycan/xylan/chitin deacetylase (PgdA/CDA1 family)